MNKLQEGPPPLTAKEDPTSFWTFIAAWGDNWMWCDIVNGNKSIDDMQWVAEGMTAGTLIWTTDGSYDRKQAADLSGAGWIIFCKAIGQRITGFFWEQSITASLFQAEMLGLCALHLLARANTEHYNLGRWTATMCVCFWPPVPRWGPVKHEIPISTSPLDDVLFHTLGLSSTTPPETPPQGAC